MLKRTLGGRVRVETALAASDCRCSIEPNQLENALLNLALNARDAMPDGGILAIRTERVDPAESDATAETVPAGDYVVITVADTGAGMSADVQRHAFEPFFTTKGAERGTGLGLSQVYGFVNRSGGHIRLVSKIGEGTTIKLYLPSIAERAATFSADAAESVSAPARAPVAAQCSMHGPVGGEIAA